MKRLFVIFCLLIGLQAYAENVEMPVLNQSPNIKLIVENNERNVQNALNNITFENDEYIKISGKVDLSGKLKDFKVDATNISVEKANLIIEKLKTVSNIKVSSMNEFRLYIFARPKYSIEKTPDVAFDLTSKENEATLLANKKKLKEHYQEIYYNRSYIKWISIVKKYKINKPTTVKIKIDKAGNLLSSKIIKSSDNKEYDSEILKLIKDASPFQKLNTENIETLDYVLYFNKQNTLSNKIASNFNDTFRQGFDGIARIMLDNRGDLLSCEIIFSTKNEQIDKEIISSIKKTKNFFETIKYEDNPPFVKYITFKQRLMMGAPVLQINYFSLGDDINPKQQEIASYINKVEYLVKKNWTPVDAKNPYSITAMFIITKNGKISGSAITKSSNNPEADKSVLDAINAAILPDIPDELNNSYVPVEMTFDYSINPEINPILKELFYSKDKKK